jgi:hypothetical protein
MIKAFPQWNFGLAILKRAKVVEVSLNANMGISTREQS